MDEAIKEAIQLKEAGTPLSDEVRKTASAAARRLFHEWGKLGLENGLLYRRANERKELVLPAKYKDLVLKKLHSEMAHVRITMHKIEKASNSCESPNGQYYIKLTTRVSVYRLLTSGNKLRWL